MVQHLDLSTVETVTVSSKRAPPPSRKRKRPLSQPTYKRGSRVSVKGIDDNKLKRCLKHQEKLIDKAQKSSKTNEILLPYDAGSLVADGQMEKTYKFTQRELKENVDLQTRNKVFDLDLPDFGPYAFAYTRNGRHLLLGGRKGHLSMLDWSSYNLLSEIYVQERIRDVVFLHNHTMFAAAQQKYVYIYDHNGIELHCLKKHIDVNRMTFLPYHYLLCTVGKAGFLKYLDTSTGEMVCEHRTRLGSCNVIAHNPYNAIVHLGHHGGTVTLWSPNMTTPVVKMLCHKGPIQALAVDSGGRYMVTTGGDGTMKVWDIRTFKKLHSYYTLKPATNLAISQRGLLAVGFGPHIQVWKDSFSQKQQSPYMSHILPGKIVSDLHFCPFEDVLGISHNKGFASIIIPGSAEPNFDTYEANPYESKSQRREQTVHSLLDKIQPTMISLDPNFIGDINRSSKALYEQDLKAIRNDKRNAQSTSRVKFKMRGRNTSSKRWRKKRANIIDAKTLRLREELARKQGKSVLRNEYKSIRGQKTSALDRFLK
uniref:BING4CT-domain-containing protein n=1 Tax=Hirondellea gigas TaxID=1518452 RepID=A0A6A7G7H8_9CRUS